MWHAINVWNRTYVNCVSFSCMFLKAFVNSESLKDICPKNLICVNTISHFNMSSFLHPLSNCFHAHLFTYTVVNRVNTQKFVTLGNPHGWNLKKKVLKKESQNILLMSNVRLKVCGDWLPRVQQEQLAAIFLLLRENQETLGEVTEGDMEEQLKLYSLWDTLTKTMSVLSGSSSSRLLFTSDFQLQWTVPMATLTHKTGM